MSGRGPRLLLEATVLGEASGTRGIGRYVRGLLDGLERSTDLEVTVLTLQGVPVPGRTAVHRVSRRLPNRLRPMEQGLKVGRELARMPGDVVHGAGVDPPPIRGRRPHVTTLFDLIPLLFDDPALATRRRRFLRLAARHRSAAGVIAISDHTRRTGIEHLGLNPARVHVCPLGVGPEFRPDGAMSERVAPYLLLVGQYARRKGFAEAFEVVGRMAEAGAPHVLRVVGAIAPWVRDDLERLRHTSAAPHRIELVGHVDDLASQYRGADALLVTSRYEGFGLPPLEAMACGTPVVSFDNSALPEVIGDAGVLVQDGDVDRFAHEVLSLLASETRQEHLRGAGLERSARFTWEACARAHAAVYREVGGWH